MTGTWTYPVTDWRTGQIVHDDAPFTVDTLDTNLGIGAGSFKATLNPSKLRHGLTVDDVLAPGRRVVWPCLDREPFGAYVVNVSLNRPLGSKVVPVDAVRVDTFLRWREIRHTLVFQDVDQLDMARDIVRYCTGRPTLHTHRDYPVPVKGPAAEVPWLVLDDALSGVRRTRLDNDDGFQSAKLLTGAAALTSLVQLQDGFDWDLSYHRDPDSGQFTARTRLGYPRLGRPVSQTGLAFEYPGGNIRSGTVGITSIDTATDVLAIGTGDDKTGYLTARAVDQAAHDLGWPLRETHIDHDTVSEVDTLQSKAADWVRAFGGVNIGWQVELVAGRNPRLGSYLLGDWAKLHIVEPSGTTLTEQRVVGLSVKPGTGVVTPTLAGG